MRNPKKNTLRQKIAAADCPVMMYELIPPGKELDNGSGLAYARCAMDLVNSARISIDAINIPDIRDEMQNGQKRVAGYEVKTDPREFVSLLRQASSAPLDFVINRATVYDDVASQQRWFSDTHKHYGVSNVVLVGGESSLIQYPGPSVRETAELLHAQFPQSFFCGGITIPTRRKPDSASDEPVRLISKAEQGMEFFTSQVLYEAKSICLLLKDYQVLCEQKDKQPKRIFLSFAPVSTRKDLEFLKWLGVSVPQSIEQELFEANIGTGWRSVKITKAILQEVLSFVYSNRIQVPLGLNIEHITRHNFELSKELIEALGGIYAQTYSPTSALARQADDSEMPLHLR